MSCYHPLIGIYTGEYTSKGKNKIKIIGSADNYTIEEFKKNGNGILIPCGKCIGCRLDYSRKWADRMMLELETNRKAVFLTLTYNTDALLGKDIFGKDREVLVSEFYNDGTPKYATLSKRDAQLFMKRLRKEFGNVSVRFYLAGEYGDKNYRPHLHCILFGIDIDSIGDCVLHGYNGLNQPYYISKRMYKVWRNGNVLVCPVSWNTCAYVSRYVTKKINGMLFDEKYAFRNVIQEFALMSRNPGLGYDYLRLHPNCLDYSSINLTTSEGGKKIEIPQYYLRIINNENEKNGLYDPDKYANIKETRKLFTDDRELLKLMHTDLGYSDMLEAEENVKISSIRGLKRGDL